MHVDRKELYFLSEETMNKWIKIHKEYKVESKIKCISIEYKNELYLLEPLNYHGQLIKDI